MYALLFNTALKLKRRAIKGGLSLKEELKQQLSEKDKEQEQLYKNYTKSKRIEKFGKDAFWAIDLDQSQKRPISQLFMGIAKWAFHVLLWLVIYVFLNTFIPIFVGGRGIIISYCILYLPFLLIGKFFRNKFEQQLWALTSECNLLRENYFLDLRLEYKIQDADLYDHEDDDPYSDKDEFRIDKNCDVIESSEQIAFYSNGEVRIHLNNNFPFEIYHLTDYEQDWKYKDRVAALKKSTSRELKEIVASLEFSQNFGIIIDEKDSREALKYFTPTVQTQMITSPTFSNSKKITIENNDLKLYTDYGVAKPTDITLFSRKSVTSWFGEVEDYCKKFSQTAEKVASDLGRIKL